MKPFLITLLLLSFYVGNAQDNYEIQVYGSQTQLPGTTMFELHSNYTFNGEKDVSKGVLPSNHALHETLEITTGVSNIFEMGVYLFTAYIPWLPGCWQPSQAKNYGACNMEIAGRT